MGLNLCDAILEDDDIYGDGVNIAARLQEVCAPGALAVTAVVHDQLSHERFSAVDLGEIQLKHVSRPIRAFMFHSGERSALSAATPTPSIRVPARTPSLAILPLAHSNRADAHFATGIVEEVVGALTSLREMIVISHGSTTRYRNRRIDKAAVRRELGVRYLLHGSLRRSDERLRVNVELTDTESDEVIWAEHYDELSNDLFELTDRIATQIVEKTSPRVRQAELKRANFKRPENMDAYDYVLQAIDLMYRLNVDDFMKAQEYFEKSIRLEPTFAKAYALYAKWYGLKFGQGWSTNPDSDRNETDRLAREAVRLDGTDGLSLAICGHHRSYLFRDYDQALAHFERALAASPGSAMVWTLSSPTFSYIGDSKSAIARAERGLRLSPLDVYPFWYQTSLTLAHYAAGNYEKTVEWGRKIFGTKPSFTANMRFLIAGLVGLGRRDEAHRVAGLLLELEPDFRVEKFMSGYAFQDPAKLALFSEHLQAAGLPA
jgi:TolB-like protein